MIELTGDDAELMKLDERNETSGKDGATVFWEDDPECLRRPRDHLHLLGGRREQRGAGVDVDRTQRGTPFTYRA